VAFLFRIKYTEGSNLTIGVLFLEKGVDYMIEVKEKKMEHEGMTFHLIPNKKFKTVNIVMKCKGHLDRETITNRALLPLVLEQGTKSYPTEQSLMMKLDELYGAVLTITGMKKGNYHILHFQLEVANERFIDNESTIMKEALQLFNEIIFKPNRDEQGFKEAVVTREKTTLKSNIESIYDNKVAFANRRLIDYMCAEEKFSIHTSGYEEDLSSITGESLSTYYDTLLETDQMDLYVLGDIDLSSVSKQITETFSRKKQIDVPPVPQETISKRAEVQTIVEKQPIQQAKLHIGYRTNCTFQDDGYAALQVFNGLYGGFPNSKLFLNVREKHSLAYYAASQIESHKGLLFVLSGIEVTDNEKAQAIISEQFTEMQAGNFTEEEMEEVKNLIVSGFKETLDNPNGIIELLYQQVVGNTEMSPQTLVENIQNVSVADVLHVAKNIELDTIYLLTNEQGGGVNE